MIKRYDKSKEKLLTFVELLFLLDASFELGEDLRVDGGILWGILSS